MKVWKYFSYIALILMSVNLFAQQAFHTSNTNVDYEMQTGTINITTRLYTAGIESAVGEKTSNKSSFESKLKNYLSNKASIKVNGKPINVTFNGFQTNDQTTRIYLKADKVSDISSLEIKFGVLMDVYEDQQNFISVDIKNNRKNLIIRKENEILKITF